MDRRRGRYTPLRANAKRPEPRNGARWISSLETESSPSLSFKYGERMKTAVYSVQSYNGEISEHIEVSIYSLRNMWIAESQDFPWIPLIMPSERYIQTWLPALIKHLFLQEGNRCKVQFLKYRSESAKGQR